MAGLVDSGEAAAGSGMVVDSTFGGGGLFNDDH